MPAHGPSRRAALAALGSIPVTATLTAAQQPAFSAHEHAIPVQGKAGPGLEPIDSAMIKIMDRHGIPGAALAIAKGGRLVLAKGYGWADLATGTLVRPDMLFGLASLTKSITAAATLKLVEQGKLALDDKVFDRLNYIRPPRGAKSDPRLHDVTIRQCLNHSGGWDRTKSGDPVNWESQICRSFRTAPPLTATQFLSFMMSVPLDFAPGTDAQYSNVGYVILGEVIAKVSGQTYGSYVFDSVLKPMGIKSIRLNSRDGKYPPRTAHRHLAGTHVPLPPMRFPMVDATGGWLGSAVDVVRFLTNLDGSRGEPVLGEQARAWMVEPPPAPLKPRENGSYFGLGWDSVQVDGKSITCFKDGSSQGMRTYMKRVGNGVNWALLFNASMEMDGFDAQITLSAIQEVRRQVEALDKYPDIDLFAEFA